MRVFIEDDLFPDRICFELEIEELPSLEHTLLIPESVIPNELYEKIVLLADEVTLKPLYIRNKNDVAIFRPTLDVDGDDLTQAKVTGIRHVFVKDGNSVRNGSRIPKLLQNIYIAVEFVNFHDQYRSET